MQSEAGLVFISMEPKAGDRQWDCTSTADGCQQEKKLNGDTERRLGQDAVPRAARLWGSKHEVQRPTSKPSHAGALPEHISCIPFLQGFHASHSAWGATCVSVFVECLPCEQWVKQWESALRSGTGSITAFLTLSWPRKRLKNNPSGKAI